MQELTTEQKRQQLRNFVQGGDGTDVEGIIYEATDEQHGHYFYVFMNGARCICNTREQADKLLHIQDLGV